MQVANMGDAQLPQLSLELRVGPPWTPVEQPNVASASRAAPRWAVDFMSSKAGHDHLRFLMSKTPKHSDVMQSQVSNRKNDEAQLPQVSLELRLGPPWMPVEQVNVAGSYRADPQWVNDVDFVTSKAGHDDLRFLTSNTLKNSNVMQSEVSNTKNDEAQLELSFGIGTEPPVEAQPNIASASRVAPRWVVDLVSSKGGRDLRFLMSKTLTESDVNPSQSRLLIHAEDVDSFILPALSDAEKDAANLLHYREPKKDRKGKQKTRAEKKRASGENREGLGVMVHMRGPRDGGQFELKLVRRDTKGTVFQGENLRHAFLQGDFKLGTQLAVWGFRCGAAGELCMVFYKEETTPPPSPL